MSIWYHGTTKTNSFLIKKEGFFKEGTWFAKHMEDAKEFGGPIIYQVEVHFNVDVDRWQVCASNPIPISTVKKMFTVYQRHGEPK